MNHFLRTCLRFISQHRIKVSLVFFNVLFGVVGLFLFLMGAFPFGPGNFLFFSVLILLVSLYRPVWIFLLLVGMLPYEIINLAPVEFGISLRPYQWLTSILLLAVGIRSLAKRPILPPFRFMWIDCLPILFSAGAYLAAIGLVSSGVSIKLALVLSSFAALFFLTRFFVRTEKAAVNLLPFLISSFLVVAFWSIVQNILFALGQESFQVMAGRPNGTFSESDWLGMYVLLPIAISLSWLYRNEVLRKDWYLAIFPLGVFFVGTLVLFLSMTRSAWLGLVGMGIFFAGITLITFLKLGDPKRAFLLLGKTALVVCLVLIAIPILHLSRFSLFDRAVSTGGIQKITIACLEADRIPEHVQSVEELPALSCQHILLEEQEVFRASGYVIEEIGRDDPNVSLRQSIYERAVSMIREHPFRGIGWGVVGMRLGTDEHGSSLNASNMFLEFWLGSGLVGLLSFMILWFAFGFQSGRGALMGGGSEIAFHLFLHLTWIGFLIFNLFNSGILLGFFFVFLGFSGVLFRNTTE